MRRTPRQTVEMPRLELMPLLDVVFLLLTFFAFAMLLMVQADVLGVELPVVEGAEQAPQPGVAVVVAVAADGSMALDGSPMPWPELIDALTQRRDQEPELAVLLEVDTNAPSGRLIEVVQGLRGAGLAEFGLLGIPNEPPR
ncbi:MAG: biopolymer transporter ExbD [Planctomycetota bacterium]